ncbi:MAG: RHS repeat-associated core domain-containing protein [Candidatus Sulfotelmatobacter sp.]
MPSKTGVSDGYKRKYTQNVPKLVQRSCALLHEQRHSSDYYPYGGEISITYGDLNRYKFTGKERDTESGLDNFGARFYGSNIGRFMTPDWAAKPITVQSRQCRGND